MQFLLAALAAASYQVSLPENREVEICQASQCHYYFTNEAKFVVDEKTKSLTVCENDLCESFEKDYEARLLDLPKTAILKIGENQDYEKSPWDQGYQNPWELSTKSGKGTSSFVKAMGKYGKKGVEKASQVVADIASGTDKAWAGFEVNGISVEGRYDSTTNSWTVSAKGNGWQCQCSSAP